MAIVTLPRFARIQSLGHFGVGWYCLNEKRNLTGSNRFFQLQLQFQWARQRAAATGWCGGGRSNTLHNKPFPQHNLSAHLLHPLFLPVQAVNEKPFGLVMTARSWWLIWLFTVLACEAETGRRD